TCDRFYTHAAEGVLRVLDAVPEQESLAWRNDVHQLQAALRPILAQTADGPKEREKRVKELHRILVDFVGRLPLVEMRPLVRPATWAWTASLITISFVSLYLAYLHGTVMWELEYAYPFGPPSRTPRAGPYLEVARSIVLLAMALYLLESTLRPEYGRLLLDWSWKSWRMPLVGTFRLFGLASAVLLSWVVGSYILSTAPKNLTVEARQKFEQIKQDKTDVQYLPEHLAALVRESQPGFLGHLEPYKWYLPYSWVNYVGFGLPLLVVTAFSVVGDAQRLIDERQGLFRVLSNARLPDTEINAAFGTFFDICFHHTQRYITVLAWISGTIAFELIVSKGTLAPAGLMYEFLASAVVGALTLVWIGVLIHFYEGAYQRCCAEKRRRQKLSDEWEHNWRTTKFLYRCFFGHAGGIFAALYIVPFVLNFGRMWT
ncbi:MAG TPA: hypothetical protein VFV87_06040, partial [Pirellulaceae bacterium]|nr:hypothetical protein [Pirellulaceae bacterium]